MSRNNIYPYVYKCTHRVTGEFYIGVRYANRLPAELDFPNYKTSSKKVKPIFDEFHWEIIALFFTKEDAYDFEQELIFENFNDPLILNGSCFHNKSRWYHQNHSDETKSRMKASAKLSWESGTRNTDFMKSDEWHQKLKDARKNRPSKPHSDETRHKMREAHKTRGPRKPMSDETKKKISDAAKARWALRTP